MENENQESEEVMKTRELDEKMTELAEFLYEVYQKRKQDKSKRA